MELDRIVISGARQHNLKHVTVEIPKQKLVVFTGVSGSGKSSLAFDTLYAEGQRRYIESLSAYARQFLGQMDKPPYDSIKGLAPTISIEQKTASTNPRSTVGTVTEIHDYLRVLWARVGRLTCHRCGRAVSPQSAQQIVHEILALAEGTKFLVLAPLVKERKGEHREVIEQVRKSGFVRLNPSCRRQDTISPVMDERPHRLLRVLKGDFGVGRGHPLPYGAAPRRDGVNFAVVSHGATAVALVLFLAGEEEPVFELPLDPRFNKTGDIWHVFICGLDPGIEYGFRAERDPNPEPHIHRFDPTRVLIDPYSKAVAGLEEWGADDGNGRFGRLQRLRSRVVDEEYDWGRIEQPLNLPLADSIIYEVHVRGFTRHPSSGVAHPGTFAGLTEKIPYLRELGVTAVELMPVTEFEECDNPRTNPLTGRRLVNFWGYQPVSFLAPKASYARDGDERGAVREFKSMVKALHEAGIEVILDIVFNHTAEGNEQGPTFCFRGLDNETYYLLEPGSGHYLNYSGCGNTLNCNHPVVRGMILTALRYWVTETHVDGFRFDLASILGRGRDGSVLPNPPLLELIAADPVLAHTKLIAEAWDAAGLYQVGSFPSWGRWAEWNGRFRDEVRRFVRGDPGMAGLLATRLAGSADLYRGSGRAPYHSINFVTSHDGFTLADLVSYDRKHNEANGEEGRDGSDENFSWNCGEEGPSSSPEVNALRRRQARNLVALLLLSQGVPMILGGDEMGRTQGGNNNAYCHDDETSWVEWTLKERNADLFRFVSRLIRFRRAHAALRRRTFFDDDPEPSVAWHGMKRDRPDWSAESRSLAMHLLGGRDDDIYLAANAQGEAREFELPALAPGKRWRVFVDTLREPPEDVAEPGEEPALEGARTYRLGPWSVVVLVGR